MSKKKIILWLSAFGILLILTFSLLGAAFLYPNIRNNSSEAYIYIYDNDSFNDVMNQLQEIATVKYPVTTRIVAKALKYDKIRSGKYKIDESMNNVELIHMLRNGRQVPVNLTFNNIRTKEQLAARLAAQLMPDSTSIIFLLNDSAFLAHYGLSPNTSVSLFLPNTYEVFWNISAKKLFERMAVEYNRFWNDDRKAKAAQIPLTQSEVSILASIVDSESNVKKEKPVIAGLYLNRLKRKMLLQADPTVIFATGDFSIRRVTKQHTQFDSPYNTYRYVGLPPGPIRIASLEGIDAVLNYDKNDYLYMCAKETFNGEHNFAKTWSEHLVNARKYQKALNEKRIK